MGAADFTVLAEGASAEEAFRSAVDEARYLYGHGGYTGTIAEKGEFRVIGQPMKLEEARALADKLIEDDDEQIADKWGPAGCIPIEGGGKFLFFGWASE